MPYVKETLNVVDLGRPLHAGCFSLPRQRGTFPLVLPSCRNCLPTLPVCSQCALLDLDAKLGSTAKVGRFRRRTAHLRWNPCKTQASGGGPRERKPAATTNSIDHLSSKLGVEKRNQSPALLSSRAGKKARARRTGSGSQQLGSDQLDAQNEPEPSLFLWLVKRASQLGSTRCSSLAGSWLDPTTICYIKF